MQCCQGSTSRASTRRWGFFWNPSQIFSDARLSVADAAAASRACRPRRRRGRCTWCWSRHAHIEDPDHVRRLEEEKKCGARQRMLLRFLERTPAAGPCHRGLAERRMNAGNHLARILGLLPTYGAPALAEAIENAHPLGAYSSDYIVNLLEQRALRLPEPGPLHLTRATDALKDRIPDTQDPRPETRDPRLTTRAKLDLFTTTFRFQGNQGACIRGPFFRKH